MRSAYAIIIRKPHRGGIGKIWWENDTFGSVNNDVINYSYNDKLSDGPTGCEES